MNRTAALFAAGLATLLLTGPAMAQTTGTSKESTTSDRSSTAPAEKPGKLAMPHHVNGSVVSVDKKDNSVTIRDSKGKEMTLVADTDTATELARLKAGDEVKVTYKKSKDRMVATKITTTSPSASRAK